LHQRGAIAANEPAISVGTKKKELGVNGEPRVCPKSVHDLVIPELGNAASYGVYDIANNAGWVSVGIDHDTARFAVNAIRSWWRPIAEHATRQQKRSRPMAAAVTGHEYGCGKSNCRSSPMDSASLPRSATPPGTSKWTRAQIVFVGHSELAR
jgi:Rhodopirellula transposase DDE domain